MRVGVYTYEYLGYTNEYLGVHIRDSGCIQKGVCLLDIIVYRYLIFTFYNERVFPAYLESLYNYLRTTCLSSVPPFKQK